MKKHSNFIILYSLWLGAIFAMLTIFNSPEEKKLSITKHSTVCEATASDNKYHEASKPETKWCCDTMPEHTTTRVQ